MDIQNIVNADFILKKISETEKNIKAHQKLKTLSNFTSTKQSKNTIIAYFQRENNSHRF